MHELNELKEMLCAELKEYGSKGELTAGSLDTIDKLAHAIKNLNKVIEGYDEEYSGYSERYDGYSGRYDDRHAYARRRDAMGRYSRREGHRDDMMR